MNAQQKQNLDSLFQQVNDRLAIIGETPDAYLIMQLIEILKFEIAKNELVKYPKLTLQELSAFNRFLETCEDGEGYDVPKSMMQRLAQIGVVRHLSRGFYEITEFGTALIEF
jgi:hypothetical protein